MNSVDNVDNVDNAHDDHDDAYYYDMIVTKLSQLMRVEKAHITSELNHGDLRDLLHSDDFLDRFDPEDRAALVNWHKEFGQL